jgi:hypothetical protein
MKIRIDNSFTGTDWKMFSVICTQALKFELRNTMILAFPSTADSQEVKEISSGFKIFTKVSHGKLS